MLIPADREFMARALGLAERGLFTTMPNPRVGCVIVRDGEVVGEGFHARAGEPHAEANALAAAGDRAAGATVYVTGRSVRGEPTTLGRAGTIEDTAEALLVPHAILSAREILKLRDVRSGDEGLPSGASQNEHPDLIVPIHAIAGVGERLIHLPGHRVARLGPIEGHRRDRSLLLVFNVSNGQDSSLQAR